MRTLAVLAVPGTLWWSRWLLVVFVMAGCTPMRNAPVVAKRAALSQSAPLMSEACRASQDARRTAVQLLASGRLERCVHTLRAADAECPELAESSWATLLECLGQVGHAAELQALITRVRASRSPSGSAVAAAQHWSSATPADDDPSTLLERGRMAEQQQQPAEAHRYFDRAVVAFERRSGRASELYAPNGFWGGVSALAWHGNRLAVAAGGVRMVDTETFKTLYELPHDEPCSFLVFSSDGMRLVAGADGESTTIWDLGARQRLFTSAYVEDPHGVRLTGDDVRGLVFQDRNVAFQPVVKLGEEGPYGGVEATVAISADGKLAALRTDRNIDVFRVRRYRPQSAKDTCVDSLEEPPHCKPFVRPVPQPAFRLSSPEGGNGVGDALAFSGDGKRLAAISGDFDVLVFDLGTRRRIAKVSHDDGTVFTLALSSDGKRLATGAVRTARVWDVDAGRELYQVTHDDLVRAVALSPDATRLASGSPDGTLRISDLAARRVLFESSPHVPRTDAIGFAPNGALLTGNSDGTVRVWTDMLGAHPRLSTLRSDDSHFQWVTASTDGSQVLAALGDNALRVWSPASGELTRSLPARSRFAAPAAFALDRRSIFFGDEDGVVREVLLSKTGTPLVAKAPAGVRLRSLAVSHDGKTIAAGGIDHVLYLIDAQTGFLRRRLEGHTWMVDQILFTKDDRRILSRGGDVRLWDAASGVSLLPEQRRHVVVIALAPDDASAILVQDDGITELVGLPSGERIKRYDLGSRPWTLEFSPDGKWFVTATWQRELDVWSVTTGQHLASLRAVQGLDAGYIVTPEGKVRFVGQDQQQAKRHAACRFGDVTLDFAVCEDFLTP
jgi:WD40 repeat protein